MGNPVVHFDIMGSDGPALEKFYAELFGWHVQSMPEMDYGLIDTHAGAGINGGIGEDKESGMMGVSVYIEAPDLQAVLDRVEKAGGKTTQPVMEIPGVVTLAMFTDPQGNNIGLVKGEGEDPGVSGGDGAAVTWFEILGTDALALHTFYGDVFGWTFPSVHAESGNYGHVDTGAGRGISGGIGTSHGEPVVTVYATVEDLAKSLERAESLGGKTVLQPMAIGEGSSIAAFRDPQGNLFGLVTNR